MFSGFYTCMETSRIIRVGTHNNIVRSAAVSGEHVRGRVTRKVTRREHDIVL